MRQIAPFAFAAANRGAGVASASTRTGKGGYGSIMGYWGRGDPTRMERCEALVRVVRTGPQPASDLLVLVLAAAAAVLLVMANLVARDQWYWGYAFALAAVVLLVLLWNVLRAPENMDREAQARIVALSERIETCTIGQHELDALQDAYAVGRELLRTKSDYHPDDLAGHVGEWSVAVAELLKRCGSRNDSWSFAAGADFVTASGDRTAAAVLLMRLSKLKHIIDRLIEHHESGKKRPGRDVDRV